MTNSLTVTVLRSSSGPVLAQGDFVLARYQGYIVDSTGKSTVQFDANYDFATFSPIPNRTPFEFELGSGAVIQGWDQGLAGRRIGEIVELTIPPSLGYGNTARDKIPANSILRFRIEIIGGFTPDVFSPSSNPGFVFASLRDFGINARGLRVTAKDLLGVTSSTIGLDGVDILAGKDINRVSSQGVGKDLLVGLNGDDQIMGKAGADLLIGGGGRDVFRYVNSNESSFGASDRIYDLAIGTDAIDGTVAVTAVNLRELGTVSALTQAGVSAVLTTSNFVANGAATFTLGTGTGMRTFLALNDGTAGFSSTTDAVIEITGFSGALTSLAVV